MVLSESQRFMVSLHFAYGLALLKKGSREVRREGKREREREKGGGGRERE